MVHPVISRDKIKAPGAEDRATLESDPSADFGGRTEGQSLGLCLWSFCPSGGPEGDKLWGVGGNAPKTAEVHSALNSAGVLYWRLL